MEIGNRIFENAEAVEQSKSSGEQVARVDQATLAGKLSTEQFEDGVDKISDANNPDDEESTAPKKTDVDAEVIPVGDISEHPVPQESEKHQMLEGEEIPAELREVFFSDGGPFEGDLTDGGDDSEVDTEETVVDSHDESFEDEFQSDTDIEHEGQFPVSEAFGDELFDDSSENVDSVSESKRISTFGDEPFEDDASATLERGHQQSDTNDVAADEPFDDSRLSEASKYELPENCVMVNATDIDMSNAPDMDKEYFWGHHGNSKEDYIRLAEKIPDVQAELDSGKSIDDIKQDPELHDTVRAYYDPKNMVKVNHEQDGSYSFAYDGRHRIAAAQEYGYDIPVQVTNMPEKAKEEPITQIGEIPSESHAYTTEATHTDTDDSEQQECPVVPIVDMNQDESHKRFEDYSYSELFDMARDNPAKATELNADFRERYEAEMRGMTQEAYQDYKYRLQAAQSKEELGDAETSDKPAEYQSEKFDSIQQRVEQFRENFAADDTTVSEDKKALGANINTIHDIQKLRTDIGKEKDACMERMGELKQENPYYNPDTHLEYEEVADRYKALDFADAKLGSWEAELDGKNYALSQKCDLPYYQQTEHYHESGTQKMDKMEAYLHGSDEKPGLREKLDTGTAKPLDKFQFDFQYERMSSSLFNVQQTGTLDERARAKELSTELDATKTQFDGMYKDYTLKQDGTVIQKSETHESAKTIYKSEATREDFPDGGGGFRLSQVEIGAGGKYTKVEREQFLYTGENTGKSSKSVAHDGLHIRAISEETGFGRDGTEYKKSTESDISLGRVEVGYEADTETGKFSVKGDVAAVKGRTETQREHGDQKTTTNTEVNVAHVSGEVTAKVYDGKYGGKIGGTASDAKISYEKKGGDQSCGFSVDGKIFGGSASAEFNKYRSNVNVSIFKADVSASVAKNQVDIVESNYSVSEDELFSKSPLVDVRNAFKGLGKLEDLKKANAEHTDLVAIPASLDSFNISEIAPKLKTEPDTAYFWSGRTDGVGGADTAAEIAKNNGGVTLETTIVDQHIEMPEWDFDNPESLRAWDEASTEYATQVSGGVHAVIGENLREGNIWENVELPRLKENPDVNKIVTIDPKTLEEKTIFER